MDIEHELARRRRSSKNRKKRKRLEKKALKNLLEFEANVDGPNEFLKANAVQAKNLELPSIRQVEREDDSSKEGVSKDARKESTSKEDVRNEGTCKEAERFHRHALYFYSKWKEAERENVPKLASKNLVEIGKEIGRGSYGVCTLAVYGGREVIIKKALRDFSDMKMECEASILAKLHHPNLANLNGVCNINGNTAIITTYYNVDGEHYNLSSLNIESKPLSWLNLFKGLIEGLDFLHTDAKIIHNDIKGNNVVLEGSWRSDVVPVLIDFGKARDVCSPKVYSPPADLEQYCWLAPELGKEGGKQSRKSDIYSYGFLIRSFYYKLDNFPEQLRHTYRSCMRKNPTNRPSTDEICRNFLNFVLTL